MLLTGDFIFSSSFDKTAKAWLFDVAELGEGNEERACIKTFKVCWIFNIGECSINIFTLISMQGHQKGVYPLIFIPSADDLDEDDSDGPTIRPGLDELEL